MGDGFGKITWWGFSPSLDLQDKDLGAQLSQLDLKQNADQTGTLNILLVGAGDCRHVLNTLSRAYRHPEQNIHFYIAESNLELYARTLLLMSIALESQERMGLQEKTELFLEIFGNSLIRHQSMQYVEMMTTEFIKMVTDSDYLAEKFPLFDLTMLKFKERDWLESIFKFWRNSKKDVLDIEKAWDLRLRKILGERYDAIPNVFDWDFSMKLCEKNAEIVNNRKYAKWRHYGVAFEIREGNYGTPNRTLASGMIFNVDGDRHARRGYWGDMIVSPYIAFGVESKEKSFFKRTNKILMKTSEDVSEFNVLSMFYELAHKSEYVLPKDEETQPPEERKGPTLTEITEENEQDGELNGDQDKEKDEVNEEQDEKVKNPFDNPFNPIPVKNAKITFLPLGSISELHKKSKFQGLFHKIFMSNSMVHLLNEDMAEMFSSKASLVIETAKYMLTLKNEQAQEYVKRVIGMAEDVGAKVQKPYDDLKDSILKFDFERKSL